MNRDYDLRMSSGFIRANDVLSERISSAEVRRLELQYGNEDLLYGLDLLGVAGPFYRVTPWELEDDQGVRRINASGYAAAPFGDMPPAITEFVRDFMHENRAMTLPQQSFSAWRAALQANLVRLLARELPSHADSQVFFCSSGTEAVEGAMKFAKAWRPRARYFISFTGAYHGKTYGSLSITPNAEYQDVFRPLLPSALTAPFGDLDALERVIRKVGPDKVVAVVVEPIQGEGGVNIPPAGFLSGLGDLCRKHGIVVVADEIQTGLGRSGHWFESAAQGLDPDIVTLAKPLAGGILAVGATIVRRPIFKRMLGGLNCKRHSNTFGGNALAMASDSNLWSTCSTTIFPVAAAPWASKDFHAWTPCSTDFRGCWRRSAGRACCSPCSSSRWSASRCPNRCGNSRRKRPPSSPSTKSTAAGSWRISAFPTNAWCASPRRSICPPISSRECSTGSTNSPSTCRPAAIC